MSTAFISLRNPMKPRLSRLAAGCFVALLAISTAPGLADDAKDAEKSPLVFGPQNIKLGDKLAVVDLPKGFCFLPERESKAFLESKGSSPQGVLGIFIPDTVGKKDATEEEKKDGFAVICRFSDCGYVTDDDADKIDADGLLKQLKESTAEDNEQRKEKDIPPIFAGNWAEKPHYDKAKHSIIWAVEVKDKDDASAPATDINYNTRILGRNGVLSMNMVTSPDTLELNKGRVSKLLVGTSFAAGKTYADHQSGDKAAGFGLAGLILGGGAVAAAAKFGVFAGIWKFLIAGLLLLKKFAIIAIVAVGGFISRFFGKKNAGAGAAATTAVTPPATPAANPPDSELPPQ